LSIYSEFRYYCPVEDCEMARLSISDEKGGEYYMIVKDEGGKKYREARDLALDSIELAMRNGEFPGLVQ